MFDDLTAHLDGPHFDAGLIGPTGKLARLHKGGGGKAPKPPKVRMPKPQKIRIPHIPPPEPPPPPAQQRAAEVEDAEQQAKRDAKKRYGQRATLLAGETGGYGRPLGGDKSLLG